MVAVVQTLREQVAWACRSLASEGDADLTLGHVSARGPDGEIWIKRKGVALDEVAPEDVVAIDDTDAVLHLETALHTGVYAARADVGAVVHGHPPYATALASTSAELALLTHDGVLFADGLPRFEDPDLIVDEQQGDRVAAALGAHRALLLNNHGVLVVGKNSSSSIGLRGSGVSRARAEGWVEIALNVNGRDVVSDVAPNELLLDFLREELALTGAKRSCDVQVCG